MTADSFPIPARRFVATLAELARLQGDATLADVLATSSAKIEATDHDNWNGGTTYYTLFLDVPLSLFARIEPELSRVEEAIAAKARSLARNTGNDVLNAVVVIPSLGVAMPESTPIGTTGTEDRLWDPGMLRLFLSHVAIHKVAVSVVKQELRSWGVSGFVAHEDIEPSLEWQHEIELGLRSMHAMAALLTPDFHGSNWTDQEIGVAVARGTLVIPVRLGINPYGFVAKNQALPGDLERPAELAAGIAKILARNPTTGPLLREGLVVALESSTSFAHSRSVTSRIEETGDFSKNQLTRIEASIAGNGQVGGSHGVPERLRRFVALHAPHPDLT